MSDTIISEIKRDHIVRLLKNGKREDGRKLTENREISIITNCIESADGSARVRFGNTEVIAGVKIIPGTPFPDATNEGVITTGMEFLPMAHPSFEGGPPGEDAIELARVVDRGIRESKMVDVEQLCITEGEKVWMCFIDMYALDHDGNLFDTANLAAVMALKTAVIPYKQYDLGDDRPLPTTCVPVSVTICKIDNTLILDPNFDEEYVSSARLTITTDDVGNFRAMQKGGKGSFTVDELGQCLDMAVARGIDVRKIVGE
ncbi:MAG: exosome complex protein Rrp42 [archaeon]|nr:exosome complex protein Rrp42 [archaeon]